VLKGSSKGFEGLKAEIIDKNLCSYCGACVSFCEHLELGPDAPVLKEDCSLDKEGVLKCSENGTCYDVCPMKETDIEGLEKMFLDSEGMRDKYLGIYKKLIAGKTAIEGQDGGVVTSMLVAGVEKGLFDCAIVAERVDGYNAAPKITADVETIKKANVLLREVPQIEITTIGLFCFESFYHDKFVSKTRELFGIELSSTSKIQIAKGEYEVTVNGNRYKTKITHLEEMVRDCCRYCDDVTARLADVSVGSIGSAEGYSTVIVRSERGEQLLDLIEFAKSEVDKEEISKIVRFKREKVKDRI
jgi:coenzyme F420 hydrogenase subunit beta